MRGRKRHRKKREKKLIKTSDQFSDLIKEIFDEKWINSFKRNDVVLDILKGMINANTK